MDLPSYHICPLRAPRTVTFTRRDLRVEFVNSDDLPVTHFMSTDYIHPEVLDKMKKAAENQRPESGNGDDRNEGMAVIFKADEQIDRAIASPLSNITNTGGVKKDAAADSKSLWDKIVYPVYQPCTKDESDEKVFVNMDVFRQVYDEYGISTDANPKTVALNELGTTMQLKMILKAFRHDFRRRFRDIFMFYIENDSAVKDLFALSWRLNSSEVTAELKHNITIFKGPPRLLDVGCGDGHWCLCVKKQHPEWIIEGLDDTNHWECVHKDTNFKDFVDLKLATDKSNPFSVVHKSQTTCEFNVRDINCIIKHKTPIPTNLYSLVRARDVFERVKNWKVFMNDILQILQPDGVVEFIEFDPRPRANIDKPRCTAYEDQLDDHTSGPGIGWNHTIASRIHWPGEGELAEDVPGWSARVEERNKAMMRPLDGYPAYELKNRVSGIGFYDVKETIHRIPVGGPTIAGQRLKDFLVYQTNLENQIPKLATTLPTIESHALNLGTYYMNLHVVTGRKPPMPRHGDLLADGSRAHMTQTVYEGMAKSRATTQDHDKGKRWQRGDMEELRNSLKNMKIDSSALDWEKLGGEGMNLGGGAKARR